MRVDAPGDARLSGASLHDGLHRAHRVARVPVALKEVTLPAALQVHAINKPSETRPDRTKVSAWL
jgi:hypothetical protein